jgi:membrane fusion protein (multidrug efflux system)
VDLATRMMTVEIDVPNPRGILKPGMFANVSVVVERHLETMTVPAPAILKDDSGSFVFTAVSDTARKIRVTTGIELPDRIEISSGLRRDEKVITTGQQFVRNGGHIQIQR